MKLEEIVRRFRDSKVLVLGDFIVDCYIHGDVSRISPEAPALVVDVLSKDYGMGGAANVVNSLIDMGGKPSVVGVVGDDDYGRWLIRELRRRGADVDGLLLQPSIQTVRKIRIMSGRYQLMRIDYEKRKPLSKDFAARMWNIVKDVIHNVNCVAVTDYDKGAVSGKLSRKLTGLCKSEGKIFIADARVDRIDRSTSRHLLDYRGVTVLRANDKFAGISTGITPINETSIRNMGAKLLSQLECEFLTITRGKEGVYFFDRTGSSVHIPAIEKSLRDVTGAGDVFTSTLALALATGASGIDAARLSNYAAGISASRYRHESVTTSDLMSWLDTNT